MGFIYTEDMTEELTEELTEIRLGHVHLKVSDLERSIRFYRETLGLELMTRYGREAAFLSYDGYHHHLGLNVWTSRGGGQPPRGSTGLYHFALLHPTQESLAKAVRRLLDRGIRIEGASDHGVSLAVYFSDPDGNGIEIYWDRPREEWPTDDHGRIVMYTRPLDLPSLLDATPDRASAVSK